MEGPEQMRARSDGEAVKLLLESRQVATGGSNKNENFLQPLPSSSNGRTNPFLSPAAGSLRAPGVAFSPQGVAAGNDLQLGGLPLGSPQLGAGAGSSLNLLPSIAPAASLQNGAAAPSTASSAGQISIFVPPTNTATLDASLTSTSTASVTAALVASVFAATSIPSTTIFPDAVFTAVATVSGSVPDSQPTSDGLSSGTVAGAVLGALVAIAVAAVLSIVYYRRHAGDEKITLRRFLPWGRRKTHDPERGSYTVGRSHFEISKGSLAESDVLPTPHFEKHDPTKPARKTIQTNSVTPPNTKLFENEISGSTSRPQNSLPVASFSRPLTDSVQRIHLSTAEKLSKIASTAYIPPPKLDQVGAGSKTGVSKGTFEAGSVVKSAEVKRPKLIEIVAKPAQRTVPPKKSYKTLDLKDAEKSRETIEPDKTMGVMETIESGETTVLKEMNELGQTE